MMRRRSAFTLLLACTAALTVFRIDAATSVAGVLERQADLGFTPSAADDGRLR